MSLDEGLKLWVLLIALQKHFEGHRAKSIPADFPHLNNQQDALDIVTAPLTLRGDARGQARSGNSLRNSKIQTSQQLVDAEGKHDQENFESGAKGHYQLCNCNNSRF